MKKVILSIFIISFSSIFFGNTAFAEIPNGTVVIGDRAFSLEYVKDKTNEEEIRNLFLNHNNEIYIKNFDGKWIDNKGNEIIDESIIPNVLYKDEKKEIVLYECVDETDIEIPNNSLLVEEGKKVTIKISKNEKLDEISAVSSYKKVSFVNPVEGSLLHGFDTAIIDKTTGWCFVNHGIDIYTEAEASVVAVADGEIEYIGNGLRGSTVVIKHSNGLKTAYSNLHAGVKVKVSDKIKKKQEIGKIGETSIIVNSKQYGPYLHFEVLKGNKPYKELKKEMDIDKVYVDPAYFVKYQKGFISFKDKMFWGNIS